MKRILTEDFTGILQYPNYLNELFDVATESYFELGNF